ncbi:MAG: hypothetical protein A2W05_02475 [Candidatus Schekmanbacteria bacterium RBG_16_38_10]|uniref:Methyltransferase type 11 domain-containing protein n=1 Tax=Candidatus Schekmanbacteria bacterium RBG_16_38_10 TaxID=1817879 RepID=A0A1F7RWB3_9BACT|nr:MAG: hypothetical protein A2W05_02475 [Candidatus Schekmanbacteria bacterium RBG_16_38_10]
MADGIDWSKIRRGRDAASKSLPKITKIPIVKSNRQVISNILKNGDAILDIGANNRSLEKYLSSIIGKVSYFSLDTDKNLPHDYYDMAAIDRKFDVIVALDVIEHMTLIDTVVLFERIYELLNPSGCIVISTPNVCHPVRFWRDCTHITPYRYDELAGLLISAGFHDIKIYRIKNMKAKDRLRYWIYSPLLRLLDIDFAPGIVAVAKT